VGVAPVVLEVFKLLEVQVILHPQALHKVIMAGLDIMHLVHIYMEVEAGVLVL
jgi:hypothetical protein